MNLCFLYSTKFTNLLWLKMIFFQRLMTSIPRFNRYAFAFAAPNIQMNNLPDQIFTHINPQAISQLNLDGNGFR